MSEEQIKDLRMRRLSHMLRLTDDDQLADLVEGIIGEEADGDFLQSLYLGFLRGEQAGEYGSFDDYLQRVAVYLNDLLGIDPDDFQPQGFAGDDGDF